MVTSENIKGRPPKDPPKPRPPRARKEEGDQIERAREVKIERI